MANKELVQLERQLILEHIQNELHNSIDDDLYKLYRYLVRCPKTYDLVQIHYNRDKIIAEAESELSKMTDKELYNMYTFLDEGELISGLF